MKAEYVSVWDGGYEVRSACEYNPDTNTVIDIVQVDVEDLEDEHGDPVDLDWLNEEFIELPDGTTISDFINED